MPTTTKNSLSQHIPDSGHVFRYCKPSSVKDGKIRSVAFVLRPGEEYLSVNWAEYHGEDMTINMQITKVRTDVEAALNIKPNGRFAKINVGVARKNVGVTIKHLPGLRNPSHSGIYPPTGKNREEVLELAHLVTPNDIFPAKA